MRERMQTIVAATNKATVLLKSCGKLWADYRKPRSKRERGAHAALVSRVVRGIDPSREQDLEAEYSSGTTWMGDAKLSSAAVMAEGLGQVDCLDPVTTGSIQPWLGWRSRLQ